MESIESEDNQSPAMEEALRIKTTFGKKDSENATPLSAEILGSIYGLMVKSRIQELKTRELNKDKTHQIKADEDKQHEEIVDALTSLSEEKPKPTGLGTIAAKMAPKQYKPTSKKPSAKPTKPSKPKKRAPKTPSKAPSKPSRSGQSKQSKPSGVSGLAGGAAFLGAAYAAGGTKVSAERVQPISGMDDVKSMVKRHEGVRNAPYKDSLGLWTVGVGHLIGDGRTLPPEWNKTFSDQEVNDLFEQDFAKHVKIAEKTPGYDKANMAGQGAMIDLAFNMGQWWPKWPNTAKDLMAGDFSEAAKSLSESKWYQQVGNRAREIVALISQAGSATQQTDVKNTNVASASQENKNLKDDMTSTKRKQIVAINNNNTQIITQKQPASRPREKEQSSYQSQIIS